MPITHCIQATITYSPLKQRLVKAGFHGGHISPNNGVLLLRQVNNRLGLSAAGARYGERMLYLNNAPAGRQSARILAADTTLHSLSHHSLLLVKFMLPLLLIHNKNGAKIARSCNIRAKHAPICRSEFQVRMIIETETCWFCFCSEGEWRGVG